MRNDEGFVDLGIGQPSDADLRLDIVRLSAAAALSRDQAILQYAEPDGHPGLRDSLARFLTSEYGYPVDARNLMITAGASHGLELVVRHMCDTPAPLYIEELSYFYGLDMLRAAGVRLIPLSMDDRGICIDELEERLEHERPSAMHVIPTFHNPTGVTIPQLNRDRLVALAEDHRFFIIADEVYHLTSPSEAVPRPMRAGGSDRVIAIGSFSKIFGPGLRLGWIDASETVLQELARDAVLLSGGGVSPVTSALIASSLDRGVHHDVLAYMRDRYDALRCHMIDCLENLLPANVHVRYPTGGYYVWLSLPCGVDAAAIKRDARAAGVGYRSGELFAVAPGGFAHCLRLSFAYYTESDLTRGCTRLGRVLTTHCTGVLVDDV